MAEKPQHIGRIVDEKLETLKKNDEMITKVITDTVSLEKKPHGGARKGAGMPKGYVTLKKRTALEAKNYFISRVHEHVHELFEAQLDLAKGEKYAMVQIKERDEKGSVKKIRHEIVTDPDTIVQMMDNEEGTSDVYEDINDQDHYYYFTTKPANNQAIEGMLNRAYGKAPEKVEIDGGFFKVDNLTINVVSPPNYEDQAEVDEDSQREITDIEE